MYCDETGQGSQSNSVHNVGRALAAGAVFFPVNNVTIIQGELSVPHPYFGEPKVTARSWKFCLS